MLVLTRRSDESVVIAGSIEISVLEIRGDQVSLGFKAPRTIAIYRKEVYELIENANREAARHAQDVETTREFLSAALKSIPPRGIGKETSSP
jgi:carbon storage regulator